MQGRKSADEAGHEQRSNSINLEVFPAGPGDR